MSAPARRAQLVGAGLIGGSIGAALTERGWHVTAHDPRRETVDAACEMGIVAAPGWDADAEITFVATPVGAIAAAAEEALARTRGVVTDVGGVKAPLGRLMEHPRFVGGHPMAGSEGITFADSLEWDHVGLHANSSIYRAMHAAALASGRNIRLRIRVAGLDAMCRMIHNGLGVGLMPQRAFELMHGVGELQAVALTDEWATRQIELVARDFSSLPVSARLLVDHLSATGALPGHPT